MSNDSNGCILNRFLQLGWTCSFDLFCFTLSKSLIDVGSLSYLPSKEVVLLKSESSRCFAYFIPLGFLLTSLRWLDAERTKLSSILYKIGHEVCDYFR